MRSGRFRVGAWRWFLADSLERAQSDGAERPHARREVALLAVTGLATAVVLAVAWSPPVALALGAWWGATALMLSWHLGLLETPDGRALSRLGPANLVTVGRSAVVPLLPFVTPVAVAAALALAALSDAIDGPLARRRGETSRLGTWLDASVDSLLLSGALVAAARLELLSTVPVVLALVRALLPWPVQLVTAFRRAQAPPVARVSFGRSSGLAIGAGIAAAALGVPHAGEVVVAGSVLGIAGMARQWILRHRGKGPDVRSGAAAAREPSSHQTACVRRRSIGKR